MSNVISLHGGEETVQDATTDPPSDEVQPDSRHETSALVTMRALLEKNHSQRDQIEEISLQAEALADGSQAQSFVLDVMDSAVRRLQDSLLDMTSQAAAAKDQATQAMTAAASSQESVVESLKTMESMGASSKQIENLAQLLQSVAKQTSLLALNAAIEAARVGEDGRGFAVIADEIRQLSEKAKGAVTEVSALVQQTETWISEGVELSQMVDAGLQEISETSHATLTEISGIHDSVEQQASEASRTYRAVREVIDIAETNEVSADEIVSHCKDLRTTTDEIIESVDDAADQESGAEIALD